MSELAIRFQSNHEDEVDSPIYFTLTWGDTGSAALPFKPPLDDVDLREIAWYLEQFSLWPTGPDYQRAARIERHLELWGRTLLDSLIEQREAARIWQQFVDAGDMGDNRTITLDATDPRVLRLPWELLADEGGHLFARGVGLRRRMQKTQAAKTRPVQLPVRILVVVARPDDAGFIDHRADANALLEATAGLGEQVEVEFLYPPTLTALIDRLRDRKAPPVHVVHFDGHGVYDAKHGLGYLLFENEEHKNNLVDAHRLGTLLQQARVPLVVLSACQSAMQQETNPYASVAARLIRAGVGSVLAMNYSVLVVAAHKFVSAFYKALAEGLAVGQAVDEGRFALLQDTERHTLTRHNDKGELVEETVTLVDWFLPALYQQSADPALFQPSTAGAIPAPFAPATPPTSHPAALPDTPQYGFHGRSRELMQLERAMAKVPIVVLHGFGGQGKTTLAAEAGRWLTRTGRFPGGAAFISVEHGGSLQQIISWVGQAVSGDPDWLIHGEGDPVQRLGQLLAERPALLILDNFESLLGTNALMPAEELAELLEALYQWTAGQPRPYPHSCLLITTRDITFPDSRFAPGQRCRHLQLPGLAQHDALALAAAVLDAQHIDRATIPRQELVELMTHLGGHPLSLNLVLPHLRQYTPAQLIADFEKLLPGFITGTAQERNESLAVSLDFSLRRLGEETRRALPDLAVFQGGCMEGQMLAITEMPIGVWWSAKSELAQAALISLEDGYGLTTTLADGTKVQSQFVRFHPTLAPYLATKLSPERQAVVEARYWQVYYDLANDLYRADTQYPHQARAIARRELPNLQRGVDLALAAGEVEAAVDFAAAVARFLDVFGRWREREALMARVGGQAGGGQDRPDGLLTKADFLLLARQGEALLQQGRAAESGQVWQEILRRLEVGAAYDADYDKAVVYRHIGLAVAAQGRPGQAIEWHKKALAGFERLSQENQSAKRMWGKVYADLGDNLTDTGRFDEAQEAYENSLKIAREAEDNRTVGAVLGNMGTLAQQRGDLATAHKRYQEALENFRALGEPQSEAVIWHQLGMVAQKARQWAEAERYYRESLQIEERHQNWPGVAQTCNQLALVAEGDGRPADAERWLLREIEIDERLGNPKELAIDYSNLANLYLAQNRLAEAEAYARRALAIKETLDLSAEPWNTYSILAEIATAQGQAAAAAQWRRKEQESYAAYAGAAYKLPSWAPGFIQAVAAAAQGNQEAQQAVAHILPQLAQANDWRNLPPVVERILAGEMDGDALTEGLDRYDAYIIRAILQQLSGGAPPPAVAPPAQATANAAETQELTLNDVLNLVVAAARPGAPAELRNQAQAFTQAMSEDSDFPAEIRALGQALQAILHGQQPDVAALPAELADVVRRMMEEIERR